MTVHDHKINGYKQLTENFDKVDLCGPLVKEIYSTVSRRCCLTFRGNVSDEAEALLVLYLIHRLKEGFNAGCQKAGIDPEDIEAYLEKVL